MLKLPVEKPSLGHQDSEGKKYTPKYTKKLVFKGREEKHIHQRASQLLWRTPSQSIGIYRFGPPKEVKIFVALVEQESMTCFSTYVHAGIQVTSFLLFQSCDVGWGFLPVIMGSTLCGPCSWSCVFPVCRDSLFGSVVLFILCYMMGSAV